MAEDDQRNGVVYEGQLPVGTPLFFVWASTLLTGYNDNHPIYGLGTNKLFLWNI